MNKAKNHKSAFNNLFEVIFSLDPKEISRLNESLKNSTKTYKLFQLIKKKIDNGESPESIEEENIKNEAKDISKHLSHLTQNLYDKILNFIKDEFINTPEKEWQITANNELLKIEVLLNKKLNSQAVALLLKLESRFKKNTPTCYNSNDSTIWLRIADLKLKLYNTNFSSIKIQEEEKSIISFSKLISENYIPYLGKSQEYNLLNKKNSKFIIFNLLSNYKDIRNNAENSLNLLEEILSDQDNPKLINYLKLKTLFLYALIDQKPQNEIIVNNILTPIDNINQTPLINIMLQEETERELLNNNSLSDIVKDKDYYLDLIFYCEERLKNLPERLELNRAINLYIQNKVSEALIIIDILKDKNNPIFIEVLFLKLLCKIKQNTEDNDTLIRSIEHELKKHKNKEFEEQSIKLLKKIPDHLYRPSLTAKYDKEFTSLKRNKNPFTPLHNLIILTLDKKI